MKYYDIIHALHRAGLSPSKVADALAVPRSVVSEVVRGTSTSYNVASYIASVTSIPLNRLFPDGRYNKPPKTNSRRAVNLTSTKGRAAA
jgi:hypothetical protein